MAWIRMGLAVALCGAAALDASAQNAAPDGPPSRGGGFGLDLGVGSIVGPRYSGSRRYEAMVLPSVRASYADSVFVGFPDLLRIDAPRLAGLDLGGFSAGPLMRYRFGRREKDDRAYLRGLGNIQDTLELGGFVA
jgi:outer membrane scaffolding protein for murein synthesis (MipA/OmpV family)